MHTYRKSVRLWRAQEMCTADETGTKTMRIGACTVMVEAVSTYKINKLGPISIQIITLNAKVGINIALAIGYMNLYTIRAKQSMF